MDVQDVLPPPAVWTCRVSFLHQQYGRAGCPTFHLRTVFVNAVLSGIRSARYQNGKECRCSAGTSSVQKYGDRVRYRNGPVTRLRCRMPEMPMPAVSPLMPMPSYARSVDAHAQPYLAPTGCSARPALFFCSHLYIEN